MEFLCLSVSLFPSVPSLSTFFPAITKVDVSVLNKTACSTGIFWTMLYHYLAIMPSFCYIIHFSHSSESVSSDLVSVSQSVQSLSRVRLFVTPWIAARQASLSITNSRSSLRLTSIESVMPSSHLILCRPKKNLCWQNNVSAFEYAI